MYLDSKLIRYACNLLIIIYKKIQNITINPNSFFLHSYTKILLLMTYHRKSKTKAIHFFLWVSFFIFFLFFFCSDLIGFTFTGCLGSINNEI